MMPQTEPVIVGSRFQLALCYIVEVMLGEVTVRNYFEQNFVCFTTIMYHSAKNPSMQENTQTMNMNTFPNPAAQRLSIP